MRPMVAGEREEVPGHHEYSFMDESSEDLVIVDERVEVINYSEAGDYSDSDDQFEDMDDIGSAIERILTENSLEKFLIPDSKPEKC